MQRKTLMKAAVATAGATVAGSVLAEDSVATNSAPEGATAMLSRQVGRVKITRIVEMPRRSRRTCAEFEPCDTKRRR
jgi:hypothetical protein